MTATQIALIALVFVGAAALVAGGAMLVGGGLARQRVRDRAATAPRSAGPTSAWLRRLAAWTEPLGRFSAPAEEADRSHLRRRFLHAGIRHEAAPAAYFGVKTLLTLSLPAVGYLVLVASGAPMRGSLPLLAILLLAAIGYYLPNVVLGRLVAARQLEVFETFPDALDLMTVCVEAGLGTEAAMVRVADDMQYKSPALADELRLVNLELRAGASREQALRNLATRTGVEEVDGFVTMILQAERFGTSIAASLRVHAETLRTRRRQRAEEAAAKIALKLLFPLIFCIFPSLLLVLMGPAFINVYRTLLPTLAGHT